MNEIVNRYLDDFQRKRKKRNKLLSILLVLMVVVAISTTYALKKPAETITNDTLCKMEEHIHSDACGSCSKIQHKHFKQCYSDDKCPQELLNVFGIVDVHHDQVVDNAQVIVEEQDTSNQQLDNEEEIITNQEVNEFTISEEESVEMVVEQQALSKQTATTSSSSLNDYPYEYLTLHYNTGSGNVLIENGTIVPANAVIILQSKILLSVADVQNCGGVLYYTIPQQLKNNSILEQVTQNGTVIANATLVESNKVQITFTQDWLESNTNLSGAVDLTFVCNSKLDTEYKDTNNQIQIPVIDKTYNIQLSDEWQNEACEIELVKSLPTPIETEDGDFLEYTLTVTIPDDSVGSQDVQIVDRFQTNIDWVQEYIGVSITPTDLTASDPSIAPVETKQEGKQAGQVYVANLNYDNAVPEPQTSSLTANKIPQLVWSIGEMQPGETRTLTYRCRVNPKYNYVTNDNKKTTTNKASAFAGPYLKDEGSSKYQYDMAFIPGEHRKLMEYEVLDDGNVLITYTLQFGTSSANDFTLNNVHLWDNLYANTPVAYKPYISYVDGSMHLYEEVSDGGEYVEVDFSTLNPNDPTTNPVMFENGSFSIYMGDFKPGMTKRFTYQILVDKGVFTVSSNDIKVQNRFESYSDDTSGGPNLKIDGCNSNPLTLDKKVWSRKVGDANAIEDAITINIDTNDQVYDTSYQLLNNKPTSFEIPDGSYKYQVVVNEDANFDMSHSTFKDEISDVFEYVGYVKVTAIEKPDTSYDFSGKNDQQIIEFLLANANDENSLVKWYEIDGTSTFTFEPSELGLNGLYSYVLTYYAKPKNINEIQQENIVNKFYLTGVVGDGYYFPEGGIYVDQSFTVVGGNNYEIVKDSWYYDPPNDGNKLYTNGEMYWYFEMSGPLYSGIQIHDYSHTVDDGAMMTFRNPDPIAAVYIGKLADGTKVSDYFNLDDLTTKSSLTKVDNPLDYFDYQLDGNYRGITLTLKQDVILDEDESLYVVLRNEPNSSLDWNAHISYRTYTNRFEYRSHVNSEYIDGNNAYMNISTKRGGFKDTVGVYEVKELDETITYTNIAQGIKAIALAGGEHDDHPIVNLTDGNENTMWAKKWINNYHVNNYPTTVQLPLNEATYVDMIELLLEASNRQFKFYIEVTLADGTNEIVLDKRDNTGSLNQDRFTIPVNKTISSVQVYFTGTNTPDGVANPIPAAKELKVLVASDTQKTFDYETQYVSSDRAHLVNPDEKLVKSEIKEAGIYIDWIVNVNWDGSLNDELTMIDTLPQGVELTYVRFYDYGSDYDVAAYNFEKPEVIAISDYENNPDYEKRTLVAPKDTSDYHDLTSIYYYNEELNQFVWRVNNMQRNGEPFKRNAQFQIVAKVIDPDILLSNTAQEVTNHIEIKDKNNHTLEDESSINISYDSLSKDVLADYKNNPGNYRSTIPFVIQVNERALDLDPNKNQVVLIDNMSDKMVFLEETLVIKDLNTNEVLDQSLYNVSLQYLADGSTNVRFVLPDERYLQISYDTRINVEPDTVVAISNEVYWEGYSNENNDKYENENFSFDLGITVEVNAKPSLTVLKKDQNDLNKGLANAQFELVAVTYTDGEFIPTGTVYTGFTDENGVVAFSNAADSENRYMEYNTIYRLKEIQAPLGYIINSEPYYFSVASEVVINGVPTLPTFPQGVDVYTQNADYVYTVTNERGKIILDKQFVNDAGEIQSEFGDGSFNFGIYQEANPTSKPLQTLTITYKNGNPTYYIDDLVVTTPSFNNLDVGSTYYIYELDGNGNPIINDEVMFSANNTSYVVHYDSLQGITIPDDLNAAITKTIQNEITYKLPETGGTTSIPYILLGLLFVSIALYGLKRRKVFDE